MKQIKLEFEIRAIGDAEPGNRIMMHCTMKNGIPKIPAAKSIFQSDEQQVAQKFATAIREALPPGVMLIPPGGPNQIDMTFHIVFSMTEAEYDSLGRPTVHDILICNLSAIKNKVLRGPK